MNTSEEFKNAGKEQPSDGFTSKLMQEIQAEEKALASLLRQHGKLETSPAFAEQLMAQLEGKRVSTAYRPVISKKVWWGVAAAFTTLVVLIALRQPEDSGHIISDKLQFYGDRAHGLLDHITLPYYLAPCCMLFVLALVSTPRKKA